MRPRLGFGSSGVLLAAFVAPATCQSQHDVEKAKRQDATTDEADGSETTATETDTTQTTSAGQFFRPRSSTITTSVRSSTLTTSNTRSVTPRSTSGTHTSTSSITSSATPAQSTTNNVSRQAPNGHLTAIIVGAVLGAVVLALLLLLATICIRRQRRKYGDNADAAAEMRQERWMLGSGRVYDARASDSRHSGLHGGLSAANLTASLTDGMHGRHSKSYSPVIVNEKPKSPAEYYDNRGVDQDWPSNIHPAYRGLAQNSSTEVLRAGPRVPPLAEPWSSRSGISRPPTNPPIRINTKIPQDVITVPRWKKTDRHTPTTGVPGGIFDTETTPLNRKSTSDASRPSVASRPSDASRPSLASRPSDAGRPYINIDMVSPIGSEVFELPSPSFGAQDRSDPNISTVALLADEKGLDKILAKADRSEPVSLVASLVTSPVASPPGSPLTSPVSDTSGDTRPRLYKRDSSRWEEKPYRSPPSPYQPYRPESIEELCDSKTPMSRKSVRLGTTSPPTISSPQPRYEPLSAIKTDTATTKPAQQQRSRPSSDAPSPTASPALSQRKSYDIPIIWRASSEERRKVDNTSANSSQRRASRPSSRQRPTSDREPTLPNVTPRTSLELQQQHPRKSPPAASNNSRMVRDANGRLRSANGAVPTLRSSSAGDRGSSGVGSDRKVSLSDLIRDEHRMEAERRRSGGRVPQLGGIGEAM